MASEIAALRARVKSLESENGALHSSLRKQETAGRTMADSLQCELARIQHLCNELSYTMVLQGVDPSVLSAVTSKHLLFDPAVRTTCNLSPHAPLFVRSVPPFRPSRRPRSLGAPRAHGALVCSRRSTRFGQHRPPPRQCRRARRGARNRTPRLRRLGRARRPPQRWNCRSPWRLRHPRRCRRRHTSLRRSPPPRDRVRSSAGG